MSAQEKKLHLTFHGKILDQLGFQTYQSPVASVAELVANSWDADSPVVRITLPKGTTSDCLLIVEDEGEGMTLEECEKKYLNVGLNKRAENPEAKTKKGRPILGRKGIGKFAGFGIAEIICVETISAETGEQTNFEMNINELRGDSFVVSGGELKATVLPPDEARKSKHGTIVTLKTLKLGKSIPEEQFAKSMARRFLLHQRAEGFNIFVNAKPIPPTEDYQKIEYVFPHDFDAKPANIKIVDENGQPMTPSETTRLDEWAEEELTNKYKIRWRFFFYKDTLDEAELQGVSIFANRKLIQKPFFFELSGGLGGQHGQAYMSGQVQADYVDKLIIDPISTERQRINWEISETAPLLAWGQERIKQVLPIWQQKRGEERKKQLEQKIAGFSERLESLPTHERRVVKQVITKIGSLATVTDKQFQDLGEAFLTSWEGGRLKNLIADIANTDKLSEGELLTLLIEADTLSALNVAEVARTKLDTLLGLSDRIKKKQVENAVRDYIAINPWIISPKWETFKKETGVRKVLEAAARKAGFTDPQYKGRVDLVLSSGKELIVIEFMRPDLTIDWDHLGRFQRYCTELRVEIDAETNCPFEDITGLIVADKVSEDPGVSRRIKEIKKDNMFASSWDQLLQEATRSWKDLLLILGERSDDPRVKELLGET